MAERSRDNYTALLIPWRLTASDLAVSSSYSQDDPQPGELASSASPKPKLQPQAHGSQGSTIYNVLTQQGGNVRPGGAAFVWKTSTDSSSSYRGWDAPNAIASHSFLERGSSTINVKTPDCASCPTGGAVVVGTYNGSINSSVRAWRLAADGTITEVNITGNITAPSARIGTSFHPSVAVMDDESIVVVCLAEDTTTETVQLSVYRSTDDGASYSLVSQNALPASINVDNSTSGDGYTIKRLRFRHAGSRQLLLISLLVNDTTANSNPDGYIQLASDSEGLQFDLVELALDSNVSHSYDGTAQVNLSATTALSDVAVLDDELYVARISGTEEAKLRRLRNAFEAISNESGDTIKTFSGEAIASLGSRGELTDGECAVAADTDGSIYATFRKLVNQNMVMVRSANKGGRWDLLGENGSTSVALKNSWRAGSNMYPVNVAMVAAGGRLYVYGNHEAPTTSTLEGSLSEWGLGGWSSVTMPGNVEFGKVTGRAMWAESYFPGELPGNLSTWAKSSSGGSTEALSADGLTLTGASGATLSYVHTLTTTPAQGLMVEWTQQQTQAGSVSAFESGAAGQTQDGSVGYSWQVRVSTTAARMVDVSSGSAVSGFADLSLSADDTVEYRVELRGSSIQAWYRTFSVFDDRLWTAWGSGTLASIGGSGSPANRVTFGVQHNATSPVTAPECNFLSIRATYGASIGVRSLPLTNPDDLQGRDYSPLGRTTIVDQNYRINAVGGPGRRGDSYTGEARHGYPADLLHWPDSLSPREQWRSTAGTSASPQQIFRYQISSISENTRMGAAVGVYLGGIRGLRTGKFIFTNSGGTATTHSFDLSHGGAGFAFTRTGNTLIPSSSDTTGLTVHRDECMGWWVYLDDGGGTTRWFEVVRNTEGVLAGGAGMPTRITMADVTAASPTSGTAYLIPKSAVVVVHLQDQDLFDIKVELDSQSTPDNRATLGSLWIGDVYCWPDGPESGARFTTVHGTDVSESDARITTTTERAPPRREFELGWTAPAYTGAGEGSTSNPNYSEATDRTGAVPMGMPDLIPYTLEGLYRRCNGPERPVVLIRQLPKQASSVTVAGQSRVVTSRRVVIPAIITGNVSIRDLAGVPGTTDQKSRAEALAFEELV
jgi:hypothetical protein